VEVEGVGRVVEGERVVVVIQEDAEALHLRVHLHQHLLVVVPHHKVVVAAGEDPRRGVLPNPLVLGGRLVSHADGIPAREEQLCSATFSVSPDGCWHPGPRAAARPWKQLHATEEPLVEAWLGGSIAPSPCSPPLPGAARGSGDTAGCSRQEPAISAPPRCRSSFNHAAA